MPDHLCISVRFLDGSFHGRGDGGEPEWPPSPLRLFQALVASAAAHWNERGNICYARSALEWLELRPAPLLIAPVGVTGEKYRLYVPDNVGDLVARSWVNGNEASIAGYRTEKDVMPIRLCDGEVVHYVWPLSENNLNFYQLLEIVRAAARSITHLGWGIDMVVADASVISDAEVEKLSGERWRSVAENSSAFLRVPLQGTLDDLNRKHEAFLGRVNCNNFKPVPPLSAFGFVGYKNDAEPPIIPFAAFSLLTPDASGFRPYDPVRNGMRVAGMLRHIASDNAITAALGWVEEKTNRLVLGHGESGGITHVPVDGPRLAFVPLPSIEARGKDRSEVVGSIRRVLITGMRGCDRDELLQLAQLLSSRTLIEERSGQPAALLARLPDSEKMIRRYREPAATWATVTPVILPGYDDPKKYRRRLFPTTDAKQPQLDSAEQKQLLNKLDGRIELLLRKSIRQAGFSEEMARYANIEWRSSGFWPGTDLASRYAVPEKLRRFRRLHVRISWRNADGSQMLVPGPLCLGSGRFIGLGLFAPLPG